MPAPASMSVVRESVVVRGGSAAEGLAASAKEQLGCFPLLVVFNGIRHGGLIDCLG